MMWTGRSEDIGRTSFGCLSTLVCPNMQPWYVVGWEPQIVNVAGRLEVVAASSLYVTSNQPSPPRHELWSLPDLLGLGNVVLDIPEDTPDPQTSRIHASRHS